MKNALHLLPFALAAVCFGCASIPASLEHKNYELHEVREAAVGEPMIEYLNQEVVTGRRWVGLEASKDGWDETLSRHKETLIYNGKVGNSLTITWLEHRDELPLPTLHEQARYDLSVSRKITLKNFQIIILSADSSRVRFTVVEDSNI